MASSRPPRSLSGVLRNGVLPIALRIVMPLTDFTVSLVSFVFTVTGVALAIGLLPLFLVGVPVFVAVGAGARLLATLERLRMQLFLDIEIPKPVRRPFSWRKALVDASTWRAIAYHLVQFPVAVATFVATAAAWGAALALLTMPGWLHHVPSRRADLWLFTVTDQRTAWYMVAVGGVLVLVAFGVTMALTSLEGLLARRMLGVSAAALAKRVDELEGSRARVVDAADAERRRIERDLHDGAQQRLVALAMNLGRAKARYDDDPEGARRLLDEAHTDAKHALVELRDLARGLHPAVLTDRGLDAALSGLAARSPVPVTLDVDVDPRCNPTIEAIAYFVVSEALANVAKHAQAHQVDVIAHRVGGTLHITIRDDGVGGAVAHPGSGLSGLTDRIGGVDGKLRLESPPGGPTFIYAELPCES
jgi:signal transduction histidine kinase